VSTRALKPEASRAGSPGATGLPKPELLAPAGDWDCLRAAIENGADAVYFGLREHNARARAANFDVAELPDVMRLLHQRGVNGYVALNTLVFTGELAGVETLIRQVAAAGADAIIVQDLGVVRLARALCPDLPIHASTQMTLTSAESIRLAEQLGVERVILARELSLGEIRRIRRMTRMPLEVFVHGALCVAYSGQCLTSEALGGRSANRGQCAQACRLPYELICDGQPRELDDVQYLLSPQDLAAFDLIPDLVSLGLSGLKIEGRLKTPEYVANITRHYRLAVDGAAAGCPVQFTRRQVDEMALSFSRGFSKGWLHGNNHKVLVQGRNPRKHGLYLGEVQAVRRGRVLVQLAGPVKPGDGVVFDRGRPEEPEQGGRVYHVYRQGEPIAMGVSTGLVELAFGRNDLDLAEIAPGDRIWKTDDPELTRRLRRTFAGPDPQRQVGLDVSVRAAAGERMQVTARSDSGACARVESADALQPALRHAVTADLLRAQLGRLGGTVYALRDLDVDIVGGPMVPLSVLGRMRHEMVRQLDASIASPPPRHSASESALAALRAMIATGPPQSRERQRTGIDPAATTDPLQSGERQRTGIDPAAPSLWVLCRTMPQLQAVVAAGVRGVYADFQDIREYARAVAIAHGGGAEIYLATPRIQKPAETPLFRHLLRHGADGILVRNIGGMLFYAERGVPFVADFSLNAANELTVQLLHERGARRITASYDLNRGQLADLVAAVPPAWLEVVVHQHMPMFHMEHCVFCAFLSPGTDRTNCGRPCDRHDVRLRDRVGMEHPLKADVGCRNTLFNAVPQSAAELVSDLLRRGARHFRAELLDQCPAEATALVHLYGELLSGRVTGQAVWTQLQASRRIGVTRGPLETDH
jgi:putative protease